MTSKPTIEGRAVRIAALGLVMFVFGGSLYILSRRNTTLSDATTLSAKAPVIVAQNGGTVPISGSLFPNYPPPSAFRHFAIEKDNVLKENSIFLKGDCSAQYVATLVFRSEFDYREDPARATINRSFPCPKDGKFSVDLNLKSLTTLQSGEYYAIVADQGATGLWYNPR